MRRWCAVGLLWVALFAGRFTPDAGGPSGGAPPQPGGQVPLTAPTRFTLTYGFNGSPKPETNPASVPVGAGWAKLGSSSASEVTGAAPVIFASQAPNLTIEMQAAGAYERIEEAGFGLGGATHMISQTRDGEYRVLFNIVENPGAPFGGDNEVFQFNIGDTTFCKFSKTPNCFGIVYFGSDSIGGGSPGGGFVSKPADWPTDTFIGFVSNGTDTTYKPIIAFPQRKTIGNNLQFFIYAAPGNGPVSFYVNGQLKATISDVARSTSYDDSGVTIIASGGDSSQPEARLGPLSIERSY